MIRILSTRSYEQQQATFDFYLKMNGQDIKKSIKSDTSGHLEHALIAIGRNFIQK